MSDSNIKPPKLIPAEVIAYFRQKGLQPHYSFWDMLSEEHEFAFGAAKLLRKDVLIALREELDRAITDGLPFEDFKKNLKPRFEALGFWRDDVQVVDPDTRKVATISPPSRLTTIFQTNMRTARAQGQWERIQRTAKSRPYLMWRLGPSERHRPEHVRLHGLVLPADHEFWRTAFPPSLWGCKCGVLSLSQRQADEYLKDGVPMDGEPILDDNGLPTGRHKQVLVPAMTEVPPFELKAWKNSRTGETEYTPEYVHPSFRDTPERRRRRALGLGD